MSTYFCLHQCLHPHTYNTSTSCVLTSVCTNVYIHTHVTPLLHEYLLLSAPMSTSTHIQHLYFMCTYFCLHQCLHPHTCNTSISCVLTSVCTNVYIHTHVTPLLHEYLLLSAPMSTSTHIQHLYFMCTYFCLHQCLHPHTYNTSTSCVLTSVCINENLFGVQCFCHCLEVSVEPLVLVLIIVSPKLWSLQCQR